VCFASLLPCRILIGFKLKRNVSWPRDENCSILFRSLYRAPIITNHSNLKVVMCCNYEPKILLSFLSSSSSPISEAPRKTCRSNRGENHGKIMGTSWWLYHVIPYLRVSIESFFWIYHMSYFIYFTDEHPASTWVNWRIILRTLALFVHMTGECWLCKIKSMLKSVGRISEVSHELNHVK